MIRDEYTSAYKALNNAVEGGLKNDKVDALLLDVKYAFEVKWKAYTGYLPCSNGFYAVSETGVWTYIKQDGSDTDYEQLIFAGPVGESGIRVVRDKVQAYLIDEKGVVQGKLKFSPTAAGVYSENLIAIKNDTSYSYYNSLGDKRIAKAKAKGNVLSATQVKCRYYDKSSGARNYVATYEYEFNGLHTKKVVTSNSIPPLKIALYYDNGKVFSEFDVGSSPLKLLMYIIPIIAATTVMMALGFKG